MNPRSSVPNDRRRPQRHARDPFWQSCPLGSSWSEWDFLNVPRRAEDDQGVARNERLRGSRDLRELELAWEIAQDDPGRIVHETGGDPSGRHPYSSHVHAETTIDGIQVHVDWVTATRFGPGRSLTEVRIFVDGVVAGRAWRGGCSLGFGGDSFPAVARVGRDKALVVDGSSEPVIAYESDLARYHRQDAEVQRPCAWLWEVADGASRREGGRPRPRLGRRDERMVAKWPEPGATIRR
jgi:hypothetical protein